MSDLPKLLRLKVSQSSRRPTRQILNSLEHVIVVVPEKPSSKLLGTVPHVSQLKRQLIRTGKPIVESRLKNDNATGITLAIFAADSAFDRLTWARQVIANCQRNNPRTVGVFTAGLDSDRRTEALISLVAAAEAVAFRMPSFKSKEERQLRLSSIKLLGCKSRIELKETRAESLGNNIARWFTALPPNKLDARIYRKTVQELAKQYNMFYSDRHA